MGEDSGAINGQRLGKERQNVSHCTPSRLSRLPYQEPLTTFALALAEAERVAGGVLSDLLQQYGDPNPLVGMRTILVALVEAGAPNECLCDLAYLGRNRLRRFQLRGGHIQTTVPGYFINLMRNLASEARGKRWDTARIEREDRIKHEEMLRRLAVCGRSQYGGRVTGRETEPEAPDEEVEAVMEAAEDLRPAVVKAFPSAADTSAVDDSPPGAPEPSAFLLQGVEVAEAMVVATWQDHLPDPETGQPRAVSMLWGFVREEMRGQLNTARQQHLDALTPKWDATRPRTLLLVCHLSYTARVVEWNLRREIQPQFDHLLSRFFDEFQVVYAPGQEEPA
ncbi:MAG TPA: hypothetical protein VFU69_11360 [Ktedonobacterales bacterium]|nr:hypothetical protein [Ktedonobacterales bacterium]